VTRIEVNRDEARMIDIIDWHAGPRAELRPLFELADDSSSQVDRALELGRVLVARRGPAVLGHLQLVPTTRSGEIELKKMAVVPERRGTGVGRELVVSAVVRCGAEGWSRMVVATAAADVGNLRFYQRLGFRLLSVERDAFTPATGYLTHFRADSIVRDAELIRAELGVDRWSILGQSFGGFCAMSYLSLAPDGLREAFVTGGLAPVGRHPDDVYRATYRRTLERCRRYYERYPEDRARVLALLERLERLERLDAEDLRLPTGDRLTARRFRQAGNMLGMSDGAEDLHALLELPADSPAFRHDVQDLLGFERNPLYAIVHEASYADGGSTRWSAERVMPPEYAAKPELLTGEHVYPWMFEDYGALAPLRDAAELLAAHEWPRLYDPDVLRANEIPVAAAIYADDPYVERAFSEETAALIRGTRTWVTSEYEHNGLRADGDRILGRLIDLARGRA
jgi:GNAT superfamily N-acetyltransferase